MGIFFLFSRHLRPGPESDVGVRGAGVRGAVGVRGRRRRRRQEVAVRAAALSGDVRAQAAGGRGHRDQVQAAGQAGRGQERHQLPGKRVRPWLLLRYMALSECLHGPPRAVDRVEQRSPTIYLGGGQDFLSEIGLFRRLAGTDLFASRVRSGSTIELGENVQLRSIVRAGDGQCKRDRDTNQSLLLSAHSTVGGRYPTKHLRIESFNYSTTTRLGPLYICGSTEVN